MYLIVFAIVGMAEVGPDLCKIDYMRYVDVQSITMPCSEIKQVVKESII